LLLLFPVIWQILASWAKLMPEFSLDLAISKRTTDHPGQTVRHIRAYMGNARQRPAMTAQLCSQTGQPFLQRACNPMTHQPFQQHRLRLPSSTSCFGSLMNYLRRLSRPAPQPGRALNQCQRSRLFRLLSKIADDVVQ
jgi:hypothetical protein